jgi:hypothetical protein
MTSPFMNNEVSQTGDPTLSQTGGQGPALNNALYASGYPGAPGRASDMSSMPTGGSGGGSDLANQGLSLLQQGDQYNGIMTLLQAESVSPQSIQNPTFLHNLQLVESNSGQPAGSGSDQSYANVAPQTDANGNPIAAPGAPGQSGDANTIAQQALQAAQQGDPVSGILGLMQASTMNPNLDQDPQFLAVMKQALPGGQGVQLDANGNPIPQVQTDANGNPIAPPQQTDANGNPIAQVQTDANGNPISQTTNTSGSQDPNAQYLAQVQQQSALTPSSPAAY